MPDNAPAPLPDVLAGPLLRRLEPGRLVLWLVARTGSRELFTLAVVATAMGPTVEGDSLVEQGGGNEAAISGTHQ